MAGLLIQISSTNLRWKHKIFQNCCADMSATLADITTLALCYNKYRFEIRDALKIPEIPEWIWNASVDPGFLV